MNQRGYLDLESIPASIADFLRRRPYCALYKVPGRVNLIGEHTDYNEGWVLPMASSQHLLFGVESSALPQWAVTSGRFRETIALPIEDSILSLDHWSRYFAAVLHTAAAHQLPVSGFEIVFDGDLPHGAGLSSSSAITCALLYILNDQCKWGQSLLELTRLAVESEYRTGVMGGMMDQFTIFHARENEAILLDCRHLTYQEIALKPSLWCWIVLDSGVAHELRNTAYNERRQTCKRVVNRAKSIGIEIDSLRDLSLTDLKTLKHHLTPEEHKRARYVLMENQRVHSMVLALQEANFIKAGQILSESHLGLKEEYDVSELSLDFVVDQLHGMEGVAGARMIGGGFGGCVLGLVHRDQVNHVVVSLNKKFHGAFGRSVPWHITSPSSGIRLIEK